jgi:hypothetical protein
MRSPSADPGGGEPHGNHHLAELWSPRAQWDELPGQVRAGIQKLLGSEIIEAHNQPGGFSPGLAARGIEDPPDTLLYDDVERAFQRAVDAPQEPPAEADQTLT